MVGGIAAAIAAGLSPASTPVTMAASSVKSLPVSSLSWAASAATALARSGSCWFVVALLRRFSVRSMPAAVCVPAVNLSASYSQTALAIVVMSFGRADGNLLEAVVEGLVVVGGLRPGAFEVDVLGMWLAPVYAVGANPSREWYIRRL